MAGCRIKNLYYHCKEDAWTPIESALIKLVRENPPIYTRGGRGSRTKKLMVSMMWSDISDQLGLPESRCQEIWNRIVAEWAIVRRLNILGFPVRNYPRANKFLTTSFAFLDTYITDVRDSEIPHHIYDIYRKRFSISGSIMKANCSFPGSPTSASKTSTTTFNSPAKGNTEVTGAATASGVVGTAVAPATPSKSSPLSATAVSATTCASAQSDTPPAKSSKSAKSSASGKKEKSGMGLSQTSDDHGKSGSSSKTESRTRSDSKSKSGAYRSTGRKSKRK